MLSSQPFISTITIYHDLSIHTNTTNGAAHLALWPIWPNSGCLLLPALSAQPLPSITVARWHVPLHRRAARFCVNESPRLPRVPSPVPILASPTAEPPPHTTCIRAFRCYNWDIIPSRSPLPLLSPFIFIPPCFSTPSMSTKVTVTSIL
jgi:hypothetical protein